MKDFQLRYLIQAALLLTCAMILVASYHSAIAQVNYFSLHKTLLTWEERRKRRLGVAAVIGAAAVSMTVCVIIDMLKTSNQKRLFQEEDVIAAWFQSLFCVIFTVMLLRCYYLVKSAKVAEVYEGFGVGQAMACLGVVCFINAVVLIVVCYTKALWMQLTFLCLQYLLVFMIKVLLFIVVTKFTPVFVIKSSVSSNLVVSIFGVNLKGVEIFRFEIQE